MGSESQPLRSSGIYHNLPTFDPSIKGLTAIVTGANGISGVRILPEIVSLRPSSQPRNHAFPPLFHLPCLSPTFPIPSPATTTSPSPFIPSHPKPLRLPPQPPHHTVTHTTPVPNQAPTNPLTRPPTTVPHLPRPPRQPAPLGQNLRHVAPPAARRDDEPPHARAARQDPARGERLLEEPRGARGGDAQGWSGEC